MSDPDDSDDEEDYVHERDIDEWEKAIRDEWDAQDQEWYDEQKSIEDVLSEMKDGRLAEWNRKNLQRGKRANIRHRRFLDHERRKCGRNIVPF